MSDQTPDRTLNPEFTLDQDGEPLRGQWHPGAGRLPKEDVVCVIDLGTSDMVVAKAIFKEDEWSERDPESDSNDEDDYLAWEEVTSAELYALTDVERYFPLPD